MSKVSQLISQFEEPKNQNSLRKSREVSPNTMYVSNQVNQINDQCDKQTSSRSLIQTTSPRKQIYKNQSERGIHRESMLDQENSHRLSKVLSEGYALGNMSQLQSEMTQDLAKKQEDQNIGELLTGDYVTKQIPIKQVNTCDSVFVHKQSDESGVNINYEEIQIKMKLLLEKVEEQEKINIENQNLIADLKQQNKLQQDQLQENQQFLEKIVKDKQQPNIKVEETLGQQQEQQPLMLKKSKTIQVQQLTKEIDQEKKTGKIMVNKLMDIINNLEIEISDQNEAMKRSFGGSGQLEIEQTPNFEINREVLNPNIQVFEYDDKK